jgi:DNA-binding response OmpR family regulator
MRILYLQEEPAQAAVATASLASEGHAVEVHARGVDAIHALERERFDMAILDWMTRDHSAEQVLQWIRQRSPAMPVLLITAPAREEQVARLVGLGADDFMLKPLRREELMARVKALARRANSAAAAPAPKLQVGPYLVDPVRRTIRLHGEPVRMTPRMLALALLLFERRGEVVARADLYREIWGHARPLQTRTVDTHASRVRRALHLDGRYGLKLVSVYQRGYRLEGG